MEILEIKGHFGEVKGYIDLKARVLATSLPFWNGRFWIFQSKIKFQKFFWEHSFPMGQVF